MGITATLTTGFDKAFATVRQLAQDFREGQQHFLSAGYKEEEVRKDFLDKFWTALGWDVNHDTQRNPYEQEVKVERNVAMSEGKKRADYAFYLAPDYRRVRFFVEAKKPSVDIRNSDSYFQAVRYGWNGHTPLVVLTDFEQFHILDSRRKPDISDVLDRSVREYRFTDYENAEKFAEIYFLFSRESAASGSIERFAEERLSKTSGRAYQRGLFNVGYQSIDEAFLKDLEEYRGTLARAFKSANAVLDSESLTEATQRTLDRLVFLRFLEDKLIEAEPLLKNLTQKPSAWRAFQEVRKRLDTTYNGNIFKPHLIDKPDFRVDDAVFKDLCDWLASDSSPYLFSVVPIHILGSIYERFLGSVIVAEDDRATVEQKPEVRKAGGVYYTPDYIVRYIIENTIGKQIAGKKPEEIAQMRFADIACGSGSFLLGVYDELLRYHTTYYNVVANAAEARKAGCKRDEENKAWQLSLYQRREILLNNIYGVDIDPQAVEVAQLSLYLKLLETETTASAASQLTLGGAMLPTLTKNIVCGNALVGWDIFGDGEMNRKINPMDFKTEFGEIMRRGGFDAIVGNPPYIRIQTIQETLPETVPYYKARYAAAAKGNYDIYVLFIERALQLVKQAGTVGYIVPNKFIKTEYGGGLRKVIAGKQALSKLVDFGSAQVFQATTYTCLVFLSNNVNSNFQFAQTDAKQEALYEAKFADFKVDKLQEQNWAFDDVDESKIIIKMHQRSVRLLDLPADMSRGSSSGDDKIFLIDPSLQNVEPEILRVPLFASDFNRYRFSPVTKQRIIFPYKVVDGVASLYGEKEMQSLFPLAYAYLAANREVLSRRKHKGVWYAFSAPRNLALHDHAQIAIPLLADKGLFASITAQTHGTLCPMASGGFTIQLSESATVAPEYVLGIINSRLLFWYLQRISNIFRGGWITCTKQYLGELPIRSIEKSLQSEVNQHDLMVSLVTAMVDTKTKRANAATDRDIQFHDRRIADLERQIDELVYELYGLSEAEIALVEGTADPAAIAA